MAFQAGLSEHWYLHGKVAAKSGKFTDMYDAWHKRKQKPVTSGAKVTAQESFYQGYMDVAQKNPSTARVPTEWTPAQIKRLPDGKFQVKIPMGEANPRQLSVPEKHQLAIAWKTLTYSDVGARIMGGPTKAEAREIIYRLTGKRPKENPSKHEYEVIVGNIGTVYSGGSHAEASKKYSTYLKQSKAGYGRAGGESVTLMEDGEPVREHFGTQDEQWENPCRKRNIAGFQDAEGVFHPIRAGTRLVKHGKKKRKVADKRAYSRKKAGEKRKR